MPIKLEVTGADHKEFATHLAGVYALTFPRVVGALTGTPDASPPNAPPVESPSSEQATLEKTPEQRTRRRRTTEPKAIEPAEPEQTETVPDTEQITIAQVKDKLIALLEKKGEEAPVALLKNYGANKVSELKVADYGKVIAAVDQAMA